MNAAINKKAYLYSRCSTVSQLESGDSLERQEIIGNEFIRYHKLEHVEDFEDGGRSGYKGEQLAADAGLTAFLNACKEPRRIPEGSTLVIEKIDRLTRQGIKEGEKLLLKLSDLKINLGIAEFNWIIYHDEDNNINKKLQVSNALWMAKKESEYKSERINHTFSNRRKEAKLLGKIWTTKCPYWLEFDQENYEFVKSKMYPDDPNRDDLWEDVILEAFDLKKKGMGNHSIAKKFNEIGYPTPPKSTKDKWSTGSIAYIFSSKQLYGEYDPKVTSYVLDERTGKTRRIDTSYFSIEAKKQKEEGIENPIDEGPIQNYYLPLMKKEEYYEAIAVINQNVKKKNGVKRGVGGGRKSRFPNLFRSLTKCYNCGTSLVIKKGNSGKEDYICCNDRINCDHPSFKYLPFEAFLKDKLIKLGSLKVQGSSTARKQEFTVSQLNADIRTLEGSISNITLSLNDSNRFSRPILMAQLNQLAEKLADLEQELNIAKVSRDDALKNISNEEFNFEEIDERVRYNTRIRSEVEWIEEYKRFVLIKLKDTEFVYITHQDYDFETFMCSSDKHEALEVLFNMYQKEGKQVSNYHFRHLNKKELTQFLDFHWQWYKSEELLEKFQNKENDQKKTLRQLKDRGITHPRALYKFNGIFKQGTLKRLADDDYLCIEYFDINQKDDPYTDDGNIIIKMSSIAGIEKIDDAIKRKNIVENEREADLRKKGDPEDLNLDDDDLYEFTSYLFLDYCDDYTANAKKEMKQYIKNLDELGLI